MIHMVVIPVHDIKRELCTVGDTNENEEVSNHMECIIVEG
jgi:hypothetical protein